MIGPRRPGRPRKLPGRAKTAAFDSDIDLDAGAAAEVSETAELDAPRAAALSLVANREERAQLLTGLMRDLTASGAERVAAGRSLEAMDRSAADAEGDESGPPPPTTRAEQVVRLVRVLACAGADVRMEALTIIANRSGEQRTRILEMARQVSVPLTMPTTIMEAASGSSAPTPTMLPLPPLAPLEEFHERTRING